MTKKIFTTIILTIILFCGLLAGSIYLTRHLTAKAEQGNQVEQTEPPHEHTFSEWVITQEPICTTTGTKERTCVCGEKQTETIAALGHDYEERVIAPTCTEAGYTLHTCKNCEHSYQDNEVPATGHTFSEWVITQEPICTTTGTKERTCVCGEKQTETIAALGHDYEERVIAPTCTEAGYTLHTCKNCEHSYQDNEVPATGHTFSEWVITQEPTSIENGIKQRTCTVCGAVEFETIYYESGINFVGVNSSGNEAVNEDEIEYYVVGDLTLNTMKPYQIQGNLSKYGGTGYTGTETEIVIPSTYKGKEVRMISRGAFYGIKTLERVVIEGETFIPSFTFIQSGLKEVVMHSTTPPQLTKYGFATELVVGMGRTTLEKIYIPAGTLEAYKAALNWSDYADLFVEME